MTTHDPAERRLAAILLALAALVALLHVLGAGPLRSTLWGAHFYGFLPAWALPAGLALLAAGAALALSGALDRALARLPDPGGWSARRRAAAAALLAAASGTLFWLLRVRHTFLGDGNPLSANLARGERFHPHEPLTVFLHHQVYVLSRGLFAAPGRDPAEVAWDTVALGSVIAGALFVLVAWALAVELAAARDERQGRAPVALTFLVLLAQGYVLLFFGYVENYTWYILALGLYLLAALRCVAGRSPLAAPGAALVLALALHLSAAALVPSFAVLAVQELARRGRRAHALRDLVLTTAVLAVSGFTLAHLNPGYSLLGSLLAVTRAIGEGPSLAPGYALSSGHWRDFLNEQLLVGPLGLLLFLPAALVAMGSPCWRDARAGFVLAAGGGYFAACWIAGDSNLGYARNWDLLAPAGLVFTAAGLLLLAMRVERAVAVRRLLALALAISLFHTVPWVAVNASLTHSFERLQVLPLGLGRTEVAVGHWYMTHGDAAEAKRWMARALAANPANNAACYALGLIAIDEHRYDDATQSLWTALRLRPDKGEYRFRLADALVRSGRPQWAAPELDTLTALTPGDARVWGALGLVRLALGDGPGARAALERAGTLEPDEPAYRDALAALAAGDTLAAASALHAGWDRIAHAP